MNQILLNRRLGFIGSETFQRYQNERLLETLSPDEAIHFTSTRREGQNLEVSARHAGRDAIVHVAGVNALTIDQQTGRYLVSGGADAAVRVWDLETEDSSIAGHLFHPVASITRSTAGSHAHAVTSLSIYPFDSIPSTLLTTSFDRTLKLHSIGAGSLTPVHSFALDDTPFSHSLSPLASAQPLIAVGTTHSAIKLLDLGSGLATHSLPGHSGAVFTVAWSPRSEHIIASGSADGRVLFFDIRRARSAFASLDHDDPIGVMSPEDSTGGMFEPRPALDWNAKAHNGAVTGVRWTNGGRSLVTCGHDQRIRVWDAATGRNELVHFGPRIRNSRKGEFSPLISPTECGRPGKGSIFWANNDGKGEIFMMDVNEGTTIKTLKTPGTSRGGQQQPQSSSGKLSSGGRINSIAWRIHAQSGSGLELYSGHGDGTIHRWRGIPVEDEMAEDRIELESEVDRNRKRKRALLDNLVGGLTSKSLVPFS